MHDQNNDKKCLKITGEISLKVRTLCFSENFQKKIFFLYSFSFWKDFCKGYLLNSKFILEVLEFKDNVLICIITFIKVHDLLLTLLQVKTILGV